MHLESNTTFAKSWKGFSSLLGKLELFFCVVVSKQHTV